MKNYTDRVTGELDTPLLRDVMKDMHIRCPKGLSLLDVLQELLIDTRLTEAQRLWIALKMGAVIHLSSKGINVSLVFED